MAENQFKGKWALILGASSGFGAASARALAKAGMDIFGVHLDLKSTLPRAKQVIADVEALGQQAVFFNKNAADARKRGQILDKMQEVLGENEPPGVVHVLLHSLAFGTLLSFIPTEPGQEVIAQDQMDMTLNVMAHSLVYWVQDLVAREMLVRGSQVFSMTSAGSHRVVRGYGAVSAAKAALESHTRQLALELAPKGVLVNCIQAGVTDTPSMRMIPDSDKIVAEVMARHPAGRMTTPEDVAQTLVALSDPALNWISGSIICVDGGEDIAA